MQSVGGVAELLSKFIHLGFTLCILVMLLTTVASRHDYDSS